MCQTQSAPCGEGVREESRSGQILLPRPGQRGCGGAALWRAIRRRALTAFITSSSFVRSPWSGAGRVPVSSCQSRPGLAAQAESERDAQRPAVVPACNLSWDRPRRPRASVSARYRRTPPVSPVPRGSGARRRLSDAARWHRDARSRGDGAPRARRASRRGAGRRSPSPPSPRSSRVPPTWCLVQLQLPAEWPRGRSLLSSGPAKVVRPVSR